MTTTAITGHDDGRATPDDYVFDEELFASLASSSKAPVKQDPCEFKAAGIGTLEELLTYAVMTMGRDSEGELRKLTSGGVAAAIAAAAIAQRLAKEAARQ